MTGPSKRPIYSSLSAVFSTAGCSRDVIKTKKPLKVLFSSGIRGTKCISSQLSSLIASFDWKPTHFEFRSYGGERHEAKIAFVEKN